MRFIEVGALQPYLYDPLVWVEIAKVVVLLFGSFLLYQRYNKSKSWIVGIWTLLFLSGALGESLDGFVIDMGILELIGDPILTSLIEERLRSVFIFVALVLLVYAALRLQFKSNTIVQGIPFMILVFSTVLLLLPLTPDQYRQYSLLIMLPAFVLTITFFLRTYFIGVKIVNPLLLALGLVIVMAGQTLKILGPSIFPAFGPSLILLAELLDLIGYITLSVGILKPLPE